MKRRAALLVLAWLTVGLPGLDAEADRWWAHVRFLADDALEGRDTGSPGYRKAAAYVAGEFQKAGLSPAGTDGYLQPVTFRSRRILEEKSSLALVRGGKVEPITLGDEATIGMRVDSAPQLEAPLVFVGHGLRIPEAKYDDLAGLRSARQGRPVPVWRSVSDLRTAAVALPVGSLELFEGHRRARHAVDHQSARHGHSLGAQYPFALPALADACGSRARRNRGRRSCRSRSIRRGPRSSSPVRVIPSRRSWRLPKPESRCPGSSCRRRCVPPSRCGQRTSNHPTSSHCCPAAIRS